jgi:hypothetical protein
VPIIEDLRLALVASLAAGSAEDKTLWPWLERAATQIKVALYKEATPHRPNAGSVGDDGQDEVALPARWFLPLTLTSPHIQAHPPEPAEEESAAEDEIPVNWGILTDNASLLDRLQNFCQVD